MFERWRADRVLRSTPAIAADSIEGQSVRVTGVVRPGRELLIAPRCEHECVAWRVRFRIGGGGQYGGGSTGGRFETFELRAFAIAHDQLGVIAIDGEACVLELPCAMPLLARTGEPWRTFCEDRGLDEVDRVNGIDEAVVEPDTRVTVSGLLVREHQPPGVAELGFRDSPPTRWRLTGTFDYPLTVGTAIEDEIE